MKTLIGFFGLIFCCLFFITACGKSSGSPSSQEDDILQTISSIVTDTGDVTITFGDSVLLTIPQGTSSSPIKATIKRIDTIPFPEEINILSVYEVSLDCGTSFSPPLLFTFPYDPAQVTNVDSLKPVYYNQVTRKWIPYQKFTVDTVNYTISFETDHLTPVGFAEFLTNGGYSFKFTGVPGVTVYYNLSGSHGVMDSYTGEKESYHIPSSDSNWSPYYVQDIAFALADARKAFAESPHSLDGPDTSETINVYIKNLGGTSGEYGSVSGVIYITNKLDEISEPAGITQRQDLYSVVAHEYLHLIQDYYYVMNKGNVGLWWLEALATQADRMVWPTDYTYYESEIFAISSNTVLIDMISKSWDTNNSDPNWYLAGTFLHYLAFHREGDKLSIANLLKAGGEGVDYYRDVLNSQIKLELNSTLDIEYSAFIRYLFEEGNEALSATPNGDLAYVKTNPDFNQTISFTENPKKETRVKVLPYLSTQMITLKNSGTDTVSMLLKQSSSKTEVWLCTMSDKALIGWTPVTENGVEVVLPKKLEEAYILMINSSFDGGVDSVKITTQPLNTPIKPFHFVDISISFDTGGLVYDSEEEIDGSPFYLGFSYTSETYETQSISSVFNSNGTFEVIAEQKRIDDPNEENVTRVEMTGKYDENSLTDVLITETKEVTVEKYTWFVPARDSMVEGTYYGYANKSIRIAKIPLDTVPSSSITMGYTYFHIYQQDEIASQVKDISENFVYYWVGDGVTDSIVPYTELIPSQINWSKALYMNITMATKEDFGL
jgi:hypothetical protein